MFNGYDTGSKFYSRASDGLSIAGLEDLYFDMALYYYDRPILFTCVSKDKCRIYLCSCYHSDGNSVEWLIRKVREENIIDLLKNSLTINEIFRSNLLHCDDIVYILVLGSDKIVRASRYAIESVPYTVFPTAGEYVDADEHEFDEEIVELENRIRSRN